MVMAYMYTGVILKTGSF